MKLHTVFVTRNRLELTKRAIGTYLETLTVPATFVIVDNASTDDTPEWASFKLADHSEFLDTILLAENRYPGYACNLGWTLAPDDATHLHRADNDFYFLPGWCEEAQARFDENPRLGQLGLIPWVEEPVSNNVGGNNIIRRELWDAGLRYDERPWPEYPPGWTEDSYFSPQVIRMGWEFGRVSRHIIQDMSQPHWEDDYYRESYQSRNIGHRLRYAE